MRAGKLRHRIQLQRNTPVTTDFEKVDSWATYDSVWANKLESKGSESSSGLQNTAEMIHEFEARYKSGVKPDDRIVFETRVFDIKAVLNPDSRKRRMLIQCKEHRSDGD